MRSTCRLSRALFRQERDREPNFAANNGFEAAPMLARHRFSRKCLRPAQYTLRCVTDPGPGGCAHVSYVLCAIGIAPSLVGFAVSAILSGR